MSVKKLISIREVITQLVDETMPEYLSMLPVLVRWGKQCDLRIGSYYSYKKQYYTRTITNGFVELPLSTIHVLGVVMGDHLDHCPDIFNEISTYNESSELTLNGINYIFSWDDLSYYPLRTRFNWEVQDNSIVFPGSTYDGQDVTIATLNYQEDADGWPMVIEGHIQAITTWLKMKLAKKEQWRSFVTKQMKMFDRTFIKDLEAEYRFEVRSAVANDGDWNDNETLAMSEMIGHPFTGNGSLNLY
ncbi:MAG: hypothetical protein WC222_11345 [Parachlamydiales bacterium]|jgi:hypothetical protein